MDESQDPRHDPIDHHLPVQRNTMQGKPPKQNPKGGFSGVPSAGGNGGGFSGVPSAGGFSGVPSASGSGASNEKKEKQESTPAGGSKPLPVHVKLNTSVNSQKKTIHIKKVLKKI